MRIRPTAHSAPATSNASSSTAAPERPCSPSQIAYGVTNLSDKLAVSVGTPAQDYSLDHLATHLSETTEHVPMRFECANDAWRLVA